MLGHFIIILFELIDFLYNGILKYRGGEGWRGGKKELILINLFPNPTQWANDAKMTSYRRRCDVITSHRR